MARNRVTRGVRRETVWFTFPDTTVTLAAGAANLMFTLNGAALALEPFTIVRTHFYLFVRSNQVTAAETYGVSLGGAVVSDQAAAIGVTAVPNPIADRGSDLWWFYQATMGHFQFASGVGFDSNGGQYYAIDSKAMRKVDIGQDLAISVENSGVSTDGVTAIVGGRMLVKVT